MALSVFTKPLGNELGLDASDAVQVSLQSVPKHGRVVYAEEEIYLLIEEIEAELASRKNELLHGLATGRIQIVNPESADDQFQQEVVGDIYVATLEAIVFLARCAVVNSTSLSISAGCDP